MIMCRELFCRHRVLYRAAAKKEAAISSQHNIASEHRERCKD